MLNAFVSPLSYDAAKGMSHQKGRPRQAADHRGEILDLALHGNGRLRRIALAVRSQAHRKALVAVRSEEGHEMLL